MPKGLKGFQKGHKCFTPNGNGNRKVPKRCPICNCIIRRWAERCMNHRIFTDTHRKRLKKGGIGKKQSKETLLKLSKIRKGKPAWNKGKEMPRGENANNWKGGLSFEPYTSDWTETLKRSIRERDKYKCQLCGKESSIICHHIDYDKKNCNPKNLITLCNNCHLKTNGNRTNWIEIFRKLRPQTNPLDDPKEFSRLIL